jgi:hypothetical protein
MFHDKQTVSCFAQVYQKFIFSHTSRCLIKYNVCHTVKNLYLRMTRSGWIKKTLVPVPVVSTAQRSHDWWRILQREHELGLQAKENKRK